MFYHVEPFMRLPYSDSAAMLGTVSNMVEMTCVLAFRGALGAFEPPRNSALPGIIATLTAGLRVLSAFGAIFGLAPRLATLFTFRTIDTPHIQRPRRLGILSAGTGLLGVFGLRRQRTGP